MKKFSHPILLNMASGFEVNNHSYCHAVLRRNKWVLLHAFLKVHMGIVIYRKMLGKKIETVEAEMF